MGGALSCCCSSSQNVEVIAPTNVPRKPSLKSIDSPSRASSGRVAFADNKMLEGKAGADDAVMDADDVDVSVSPRHPEEREPFELHGTQLLPNLASISEPADSPPVVLPRRSHSGGSAQASGRPKGKNVLMRSISARNDWSRRWPTVGDVDLGPRRAVARRTDREQWREFEPAPIELTAAARELARETLRSALRDHFMFHSFTARQLDDAVSAMRHRVVRKGHVVSSAGDKATHFFVCTQGGLNLSVSPLLDAVDSPDPSRASSDVVLVAQVGPCGSFGSAALLHDAREVRVTSTAAVDSEVFALSRDAFQRIRRARPSQSTSEAVDALRRVPPLATLPTAALETLAARTERVELLRTSGSDATDAAVDVGTAVGRTDDFLLVIASGALQVVAAVTGPAGTGTGADGTHVLSTPAQPSMTRLADPTDESDVCRPPEPPSRHVHRKLAPFVPSTTGTASPLRAGDCVGCGRTGDEVFFGTLFSAATRAASEPGADPCAPFPPDEAQRALTARLRGEPPQRSATASATSISRWAQSQAGESVEHAPAAEGRLGAGEGVVPVHSSHQLQLLSSSPAGWSFEIVPATATPPVVAFRLPLCTVCTALLESPMLLAARSPLFVRAILSSSPLFSTLDGTTLDVLSFAFTLTNFAADEQLHREGRAAPSLHILLRGSVQLRRQRQLTSTFGTLLSYTPYGGSREPPEVCSVHHAGDAIGVRSTIGGERYQLCTAIALEDVVTVSIDRAAAASLLPDEVRAALVNRPDELSVSRGVLSNSGHATPIQALQIDSIIAHGSFGLVAAATDATSGARYAVKKIRQSTICEPPLRRQVLAERAALCAVVHPCLCRLFATHRTSIAVYLVLELCDGVDLYRGVQAEGGFDEDRLRLYASCVVAGLGALHERGWIYRDIKAENVVFTSSGWLKLVDFGLARSLSPGSRCFTVLGTCEYMAPEVIGQISGYGAAADWWGVGCLVYEMLYAHTPWVLDESHAPDLSLTDTAVSRNIINVDLPVAYPAGSSPPSDHLSALIHGLLEREPTIRTGGGNGGATSVRAHEFFRGIDWTAIDAGTQPMPSPPVPVPSKDQDTPGSDDRRGSPEDESVREEQQGGDHTRTHETGCSEDDEKDLDPISAQLVRFMKERQEAEAATSTSHDTPPKVAPSSEDDQPQGLPKFVTPLGKASIASPCEPYTWGESPPMLK